MSSQKGNDINDQISEEQCWLNGQQSHIFICSDSHNENNILRAINTKYFGFSLNFIVSFVCV